MKIAMFSDNFYPEMSGISDSIIESARELARLGHQVDFYAPKYSPKDFAMSNVSGEELDLGENIKIHRFFSFRYPSPTRQGRMVIPTFLRWLAMRKNKPDIIHVHHFFGVGLEALAAAKFLKVPLVGTNHTPITEFLKYGPAKNKFIEKLAIRYVSWFYNHCDFVSAPCEAILKEMKTNKFRKPCQVLSNPVDIANFYPAASSEEKNEIKKEFRLSEFMVLYAGRLGEEKHVDVLIRAIAIAAKKINNISFAITGHGAAEESLKKLAKELQIEDKVKFFGTLSADKHAQISRAADVFAIASTAEMQSLSLMKAMASGLPAIGVNAWALPEYINETKGFVLEPGDFRGIAEKILFLFDNPEKRKTLGQGGLELVRKFSPENIVAEWNDIYRKISAKSRQKIETAESLVG
ncbi:MAG TPA: glycosyltransferase [Patescibacteria group bacterium]